MERVYKRHNEAMAEKAVKALEKNQFHAIYFETKEQAENFIMYHIKSGDVVAFGGSVTIKSMDIKKKIRSIGGTIIDHGEPGLTKEEKMDIMRRELTSDLFLCSSNAVTLDGKLINVDGVGNRVAAITFGPKKVIMVVGINKIVEDEEAAFKRIKNIASPKNNKRLACNNPCTNTGKCFDCDSKNRICRAYSILKRKPMMSDISVVIIGEELGF
ncbi:MAG: lactate utilization protein [Clostridium argentinense]|uniref:Lactate utilization protein n=1 Tax=Clostridium faecium TaxID=2762223 RepID=A0ABR8YRE2_9CLOT|nr:lactate utilization protein [Clostridium faecium]MBD8046816.1 lactate utilization protein [Clostridium faecium]MBS5825412.1 lactate utilization protein [Clostridium argentinense]